MPEKKRDEKDEKGEEKRGEKEEKWRRDRVSAVVWALIAVWAALIILAEVTDFGEDLGNWWCFCCSVHSIACSCRRRGGRWRVA